MHEEPELTQGFIAHQAWAYETAYRIHARLLHGTALEILRNGQDAQDCVHDVLAHLWRRGDAFRAERGSLRAFLAVCVRNEALSRLRKANNRERIGQMKQPPLERADLATGVVERESVRRALLELTEKQRQTISLAYFDHLTHEEIALALEEPVGTVKSRLSSALRRLRQIFTTEGLTDA